MNVHPMRKQMIRFGYRKESRVFLIIARAPPFSWGIKKTKETSHENMKN
jgi:hypothetical protein